MYRLQAIALSVALAAQRVAPTLLLDRNLAYGSPFVNRPELSHSTKSIQSRQIQHVKRQMADASAYTDEAYPTFYGATWSNSPFVWNGGINFTHSVASGDPFDTSVLLWTRAAPLSVGGVIPDISVPVCVSFQIFTSKHLSKHSLVDSGDAFTSYDVDFTVKVEAKRLPSDSKLYYFFSDCTNPNTKSPTGATRTLPRESTPARLVNGGDPLTLAVFSCSRYQTGYFNAYGFAAQNISADFYVHLGDYIYESIGNGAKIGRAVLGRELATIHDYRLRLNQYRTDVSLLLAHQNAPWITVWDDHEVSDNAWRGGTANSNDSTTGCSFSPSGACFTDRKLAAVRAYHEWMPIRQVNAADRLRIWRNFSIGKLLDLSMLDTRHYDRDLTDIYYNTEFVNTVSAYKDRSMMGAEQEQWFLDSISKSQKRGAVWRIVGQQVIFTQLNFGGSFNLDAWDGYRANRARVLDHLYENNITNTVILAGDSHANWVSDLARPNDTTSYDPDSGHGAIGVEFAGTAVTSESPFGSGVSPAVADAISSQLVAVNEDLQWSEGSFRGFFTLALTPHNLTATYYAMRNISFPNLDGFVIAQFIVQNGENRLQRPIGVNVTAGVLKSRVL